MFPERLGKKWYARQRATLGNYGTASLLQCEPVARGGNLLQIDKVKIIGADDLPKDLIWGRCWDLASSAEQKKGDNPDYNAGVKLAIKYKKSEELDMDVPILYISDITRKQMEAPERNRRIIQNVKMDGPGTLLGVESVAGYKDTFTIMRDLLEGITTVEEVVRVTQQDEAEQEV